MRILTTTARTAAILVAPQGSHYTLSSPLAWRLTRVAGAGDDAREGHEPTAVLFLEDLTPDCAYRLTLGETELFFRTDACAGLIDATDHGADPWAPDNAAALQAAINATPEGGTLRVPAGRYATGPVFLKAGITLYLPEGAELAGIGERSGWPILPAHDEAGRVIGTWEGLPEACYAHVVTALDCDGLAITGRGIIDGGGDRGDWWTWAKERRNGARRPRTLFIGHSDGVTLSGITVRNSPSWTVHPYRSDRFRAVAVSIQNPPDSPNTDGLNPESCCDVLLQGVAFSVGDDCIAVKAGKRGPGQVDHLAPTRRMRVEHCRMARGHGAVVLGSEMSGEITDVTIAWCEFDGTDRGLRIKARRGRGGRVSGIHLGDVVMTGVHTPLAVNAFYHCDPDGKDDWVQSRQPAAVDDTTPVIADISMTRVTARGVTVAAAALLGLPEAPVTGVRLTDFAVDYDPNAKAAVPLMACGVAPVRHAGLIAEFAQVSGEVQTLIPTEEPDLC